MENTKTFAYVRVSSKEQNVNRQLDAIKDYCTQQNIKIGERDIFIDKTSGKNMDRQGYIALKQCLRNGDMLIIKELDRLGRNKEEVKKELNYFKENKIRVKILNIPTTLIDFQGQEWLFDMVNNILIEVLSAIAEEERNKIKQRQKEGIEALKRRNGGKGIGRPATKMPQNFKEEYQKWKNGEQTATATFTKLKLKKTTFYNLVKQIEKEG